MDSWSGAQRQNLSVVIYHTLFSHSEKQFYQMGFKKEKKLKRENLNSKTLFYKDCSLVSVKNLTTSPTKLLMSKYKNYRHHLERERQKKKKISLYIYIRKPTKKEHIEAYIYKNLKKRE